LWDRKTGRLVRSLQCDETDEIVPSHCLAFTPDGKSVVSVNFAGETIWFWDVTTGQEKCRLAGPGTKEHKIFLHALALSPDGKCLAGGGVDGTVYLWDVSGNKLLREVSGAVEREVTALAFTRDGKTLAVVDSCPQVGLLEVATGDIQRLGVGPGEPTIAPD